MASVNLKQLDKPTVTLCILVSLFEDGDVNRTGFINHKDNSRGIASQGAVNNAWSVLEALELVSTYDTLIGITKINQTNYTLTDKGRKVAELISKVKMILDRNSP